MKADTFLLTTQQSGAYSLPHIRPVLRRLLKHPLVNSLVSKYLLVRPPLNHLAFRLLPRQAGLRLLMLEIKTPKTRGARRFADSVQFLAHSKANHSRHCSAVQAAFSSMMGLALGRLRRFSTVNRGGSGIVWAVSQ